MKKNILIIGLAGILGMSIGLTSCTPDYETKFNVFTLTVPDESQAPVIFPLTGGEHEIEVQTNVPFDQWNAESNAEWCKLDRRDGKVIIIADDNEIYKQRLAQITIAYGHQSYTIDVKQFGLEPVILVGDEAEKDGVIKEVDPKLTSLSISVKTNLNLDNIIVPDTCSWVKFVEQPEKRDAGESIEKKLTFELVENTDTVVRYCSIILQSSENYNYTASFLIKQQKRGYIIEAADTDKNFNIEASGKTITVPFKINGPATAPYSYTIEESAKDWIIPVNIKTREMRDDSESFVINPNIKETERVGHIVFTTNNPGDEKNTFTVTVTQEKFIPVPPVNVINASATPGAGFITLNWKAPEKVDYTNIKIKYNDPVRHKEITKEISNNTVTTCIIDGTYQCAGTYNFTIMTYGPTGMETETPVIVNGTSDISPKQARITLTTAMLSANATQSGDGDGLPALVDDNKETYYHTLWDSASPGGKPHYVQINLPTPLQNLRFEYDARNNQANNQGDVKRAGIWGSNTPGDENSWQKLGTENFTLPTEKGGHSAPDVNVTATKPYKHIRFIPEARRNADPLDPSGTAGWWNMSNMYLYKINNEDEAWARKELGL